MHFLLRELVCMLLILELVHRHSYFDHLRRNILADLIELKLITMHTAVRRRQRGSNGFQGRPSTEFSILDDFTMSRRKILNEFQASMVRGREGWFLCCVIKKFIISDASIQSSNERTLTLKKISSSSVLSLFLSSIATLH